MNATKKRLTPEEKVSHLKKRLEKAQKAVATKNRKQRNGWLISAGIVLEAKYKSFKEIEQEKREMVRSWVDELDAGDERNRTRFIEFLDHLEAEKKNATEVTEKALGQLEPSVAESTVMPQEEREEHKGLI